MFVHEGYWNQRRAFVKRMSRPMMYLVHKVWVSFDEQMKRRRLEKRPLVVFKRARFPTDFPFSVLFSDVRNRETILVVLRNDIHPPSVPFSERTASVLAFSFAFISDPTRQICIQVNKLLQTCLLARKTRRKTPTCTSTRVSDNARKFNAGIS